VEVLCPPASHLSYGHHRYIFLTVMTDVVDLVDKAGMSSESS